MNNSVENLYEMLKNFGLSDDYIEFIKNSIQDSNTAQLLLDEISSNCINDKAGLMRFIYRNFRLIPDISRESVSNTLKLGKNIAENLMNSCDDVQDDDISDDDNVISVKAEVCSEPVNEESAENPDTEEKSDDEQTELTDSDVTQHTASLWKYNPVDDSEPENHSECISDKKILENAVISAASVRGKKHKHDGTNRDDWFETANIDDIAVIAVSDGAGSKKFSRIGAEISCKAAVEHICSSIGTMKQDGAFQHNYECLSEEIGSEDFMNGCSAFAAVIQDAVISAYYKVRDAYEERRVHYEYLDVLKRDMNFRDLSATLLVALIIPVNVEGNIQHFIISCQIGDGMIAAINNKLPCKDAVKLLGTADGGAFAGETDFLTSESMCRRETLMSRTKIARSEITDVMVMTDGVADDYYPNATQLSRLYTDLALNGIVEFSEKTGESIFDKVSDKIPQPVAYPWVNDNSVEVSLNYAKSVAEACGIDTDLLWGEDRISAKALNNLDFADISTEERLKIWLDNYVERGSFDDRTLVLYSVGGNELK